MNRDSVAALCAILSVILKKCRQKPYSAELRAERSEHVAETLSDFPTDSIV